jgi:hypothetical protein
MQMWTKIGFGGSGPGEGTSWGEQVSDTEYKMDPAAN